MKPKLLGPSLTLAAAFPAYVQAATLSMRFAGGGREANLEFRQSILIEILMTFGTNDGPPSPSRLTGLDLRFDVGPIVNGPFGPYVQDGSTAFVTTSVTSPIAGWGTAATTLGPFNRLGTFASAGDPAGVLGPTGATPGTHVVMSIALQQVSNEPGDIGIVFTNMDPLPALYNGPAQWSNRFGYAAEVGRNQFLHGPGSSGDNNPQHNYHGYETFDPLTLPGVPEPSSFALLALSGMALLRWHPSRAEETVVRRDRTHA